MGSFENEFPSTRSVPSLARSTSALLFVLATACAGGPTCVYEDQAIPVGYCGTIECNGCQCEADGEIWCTLAECWSSEPCWRTGANWQICAAEPVFEPCDREPSAAERCRAQHGSWTTLESGECGFVDYDGSLAACLAAAGDG